MKNLTRTVIFATFLMVGCAAPIKVKNTNRQPLNHYKNLQIFELKSDVIGETNDKVMNKIMTKAIGGILQLGRFKKVSRPEGSELEDKAAATEIVSLQELEDDPSPTATLQIFLTNYNKGNSFARFMFGALAGSGEVKLEMTVVDMKTKQEKLKAETVAKIEGSFASESNVVGPLSKAIVKFVREQFDFDRTYQTVNLTDGRDLFGEIRKVTDDKLYLIDGGTMYIIKRKRIQLITENQTTLTWKQISQRNYPGLNYNRYRDPVRIN